MLKGLKLFLHFELVLKLPTLIIQLLKTGVCHLKVYATFKRSKTDRNVSRSVSSSC